MEINVNRPMNQQPMQQPMGQPMNQQSMMSQPRGSRAPWIVLAVVVVIVLAVLGYMFRDKFMKNAKVEALSGYQAVFLTNGQVYFGKLSNPNGDYVTLKDIFYLQVNQSQQLQSGQQQSQQQQQQAQQNPELSLVKLGNELHGPADSMQINRSQILFFEDLKSEGKVAQAIDAYNKGGAQQAPAAAGQQQQAPATQAPATQTPIQQAPATK